MSGSELIRSELIRSDLIRSELIRTELIRTNQFVLISELIRTLIFNIKKPQLIFQRVNKDTDFNHRFFRELIRILILIIDFLES